MAYIRVFRRKNTDDPRISRKTARKRALAAKRARSRKHIYGQRNATLRKMGYRTYADYMKSSLWSSIRARVLNRDKFVCRHCGEPGATVVHHLNYWRSTLEGLSTEYLVALHNDCHEKIEFTPKKGVKLPTTEANKLLGAPLRRALRQKAKHDMFESRLRAIQKAATVYRNLGSIKPLSGMLIPVQKSAQDSRDVERPPES